MSACFQTLQVTSACTGLHVHLGSRVANAATSHTTGPSDPALALASLLAEHEAAGEQVTTVTLRLMRTEDSFWVVPALRWLAAHGRRPIVRSAKVLPKPVVMAAKDCGATVLFEIAHPKHDLQRILLGPNADAAPAMLLQAQHLTRLGVGVAVHLGPLVAGLHDRPGQLEPLVRHIAAAGIHDVHLSVGRLLPATAAALIAALGTEAGFEVQRRYAATSSTGSWRLSALAANGLREAVRAVVTSQDRVVDGCGCSAHCHLDLHHRSSYIPVQGPSLFAGMP